MTGSGEQTRYSSIGRDMKEIKTFTVHDQIQHLLSLGQDLPVYSFDWDTLRYTKLRTLRGHLETVKFNGKRQQVVVM
jgi:hypothetical protein